MIFGFGLREPPNRPLCLSVAHLLVDIERFVLGVLGPMDTYFGSNLLKLFCETSRGSLSLSAVSVDKKKYFINQVNFISINLNYLCLCRLLCRPVILSKSHLIQEFYIVCLKLHIFRYSGQSCVLSAMVIVPEYDDQMIFC